MPSLENNRPELGTHRLPAVMGRGCRGIGERCGVGEKFPKRAHFWSSLYSCRPIFPSLATISLQGKKLLCTKNKCDPYARIRPGSRGQGQRARPGPARPDWDTPAPRKPLTLPGRERWRSRRSLGGLRPRGRDLNEADQGRNPRVQKPEQKRDARSSPPRADGWCGAQLPGLTWGFSFANQLLGRLSSAETSGAARSVHFLPPRPPARFVSPPQSPLAVELAWRCSLRSRRPALGPGGVGESQFGRVPGPA